MSGLSDREIRRQYRIIKQTLSMHADLRDKYSMASRIAQIITLVASTLICAMTFASDQLYNLLGFKPESGEVVVGFAGIAAFAASLTLLVLDWGGKSSEHKEAAKLWSRALSEFRSKRTEDRNWPTTSWDELNSLYWHTDQSSPEIPSRKFSGLKARHLRKVLTSRFLSKYPGSPLFLIRLRIRMRHLIGVLRDKKIDITHNTQDK